MLRFIKFHRNKFLFFLIDNLGILFVFNITHFLYFKGSEKFFPGNLFNPTIQLAIAVNTLVFYIFDNYGFEERIFRVNSIVRTFLLVALSSIIVSWLLFMTRFRYEGGLSGRGIFYLSLLLFGIYASIIRLIIFSKINKNKTFEQWVLIGSGEKIQSYIRDIIKNNLALKFFLLSDKNISIINEKILETFNGWQHIEKVLKKNIQGIIIATDKFFYSLHFINC